MFIWSLFCGYLYIIYFPFSELSLSFIFFVLEKKRNMMVVVSSFCPKREKWIGMRLELFGTHC